MNLLKEIDSLEVGQAGSMELHVLGNSPQLYVKGYSGAENAPDYITVSEDVKVSNRGVITFKRNGKVFRGYARAVVSNFKFKRVK